LIQSAESGSARISILPYMNKTLKALQRGIKAGVMAASEPPPAPQKYEAAGKRILCSHCGADDFESPPGLVVVFSKYVLQCSQCGHLECFGKQPVVVTNAG
jgi:hypothetical protein